MANRNFLSNKVYGLEAYPVRLTCQFTVDATNASGITGLVGAGIKSVFMHTSTTPATGNPNPASGIIMVQLQDCYPKLLQMKAAIQAPLTGSNLTAVTNHTTYQITALGTATTAQWVAKGLPIGVTPAVGAAFVASATGTIGGSATVKAVSNSGISTIELVGNANLQNQVNPAAPSTQGMNILLQCLAPAFTGESYTPAGTVSQPTLTMDSYTPAGTNNSATPPIFTGTPATLTGTVSQPTFTGTAHTLAGTMTLALTAPAAGSVVSIELLLSNSSVTVQGQ